MTMQMRRKRKFQSARYMHHGQRQWIHEKYMRLVMPGSTLDGLIRANRERIAYIYGLPKQLLAAPFTNGGI